MNVDWVDVFCGNGDALMPRPGSLCAKWFFPKAQCGNTVPHAARPFRMATAGLYSGGYPTGYGVNAPNTNGRPPKFAPRLEAAGFTHFHHSGTGGIEAYYNYLRVTPVLEGGARTPLRAENRVAVTREEARPGWYCAGLENGIRAELAVADMAALHRYAFPRENASLSVDFAQAGLDKSFGPNFHHTPEEAGVKKTSPQRAEGFMTLYGLTLYASVWCPDSAGCEASQTGVVFALGANRAARLALGFSFHSAEEARAHLDAAPDFDEAVKRAREEWEEALSAIRVETPDADLKRCFYSMLYHTLVKPARLDDTSPYDGSPRYHMDFSTLWDLYKTQLPLVLACYPDEAAGMVNSLLATGEKHGLLSCAVILNNRPDFCDYQARMLACYFVCSAHQHKIGGVDWRGALETLWRDLQSPRNAQFISAGATGRNTHILDLADGCHCLAQLAADLGDAEKHAELARLAKHWRNAYDETTGMLRADREYYEGTFANYSFRLLHDMRGRIELCGGVKKFEEALDRFFGFGCDDAKQQVDPRDHETMRQGFALGRFEGYNNEPDMETPYNYIFAGRHDKLCDIVTAGMTELFSAARDGLPGNNDSGGLSSCYIWNTLGIFPAFASRFFLLGRPFFERAELRLDKGKTLAILAHGLTPGARYVRRVAFNGADLRRFWLATGELLSGGTLEFWMSESPCDTSDCVAPDF
ncbi:MAG: glycoside hydrolase family 92 protein [Kiritimatiellaeota bacterium]|nr:glycoside hydrolase family 92 protein [Kiritimatiellota bacterium]